MGLIVGVIGDSLNPVGRLSQPKSPPPQPCRADPGFLNQCSGSFKGGYRDIIRDVTGIYTV